MMLLSLQFVDNDVDAVKSNDRDNLPTLNPTAMDAIFPPMMMTNIKVISTKHEMKDNQRFFIFAKFFLRLFSSFFKFFCSSSP